ncbi:MAG: 50S ribosomal protein L10 [Candidatus Doudnabacteria bacterium]|nr:50S ribosomal protein L10 [Candidatus Doudnabacteria bacterium]
MAITRKQKEESLREVTEDLKNARGVVFAEYAGLSVKDMDKVRKDLRKENVKFKVLKVTLLKKAMNSLNMDLGKFAYAGPLAVAVSKEEETTPARVIKGLMKNFPTLKIDGGIFNNEIVARDVVLQLAALPSKDQLLGQLLSVIAGPARGLVTVLSGNTRDLLQVLNAIGESKK